MLQVFRSTCRQSLRTHTVSAGELVELDPDDPGWAPWIEGPRPTLVPTGAFVDEVQVGEFHRRTDYVDEDGERHVARQRWDRNPEAPPRYSGEPRPMPDTPVDETKRPVVGVPIDNSVFIDLTDVDPDDDSDWRVRRARAIEALNGDDATDQGLALARMDEDEFTTWEKLLAAPKAWPPDVDDALVEVLDAEPKPKRSRKSGPDAT